MLIRVHAQRGASLIEVAIVLVILAVAVTAGLPSYQQWLRNTQIRNATESIQNGLQQARQEAIRLNRTVIFSLVSLSDPRVMDNSCALSSTAASWVVSLANPAGLCGTSPATDGSSLLLAARAAGEGGQSVALSAQSAGGATANQVSFNGFGEVTRGTTPIAQVDVSGSPSATEDRNLRIVIGTGGGVRLCDPKVQSAGDPRRCS